MAQTREIPTTLLDLLSNTLILYHTAPLLTLSALLSLGATSKAFHSLVFDIPHVFRSVDLSAFKKTAATPFEQIDSGGVTWRHQQIDEAVTEEDFYSGPLRGIFGQLKRKNILQDVQTLILDGLSVPAELIRDIIVDPPFNVRILSIREAKNLNENKLSQVLRFAVRPSRPEGTPRLKGLYVFGPRDAEPLVRHSTLSTAATNRTPGQLVSSAGITSSLGAQIGAEWNQKSQQSLSVSLGESSDRWYTPGKKMPLDSTLGEWAKALHDCAGIIAFDAVLCRGPRHNPLSSSDPSDQASTAAPSPPLPALIANIALPLSGCARCHTSPEGPVQYPSSPSYHFPLFAPPPLYSSDPRVAQVPPFPNPSSAPLYLRCDACLLDRVCERCHRWWCEDCYAGMHEKSRMTTQASAQAVEALAAGRNWGDGGESSIKVHLGFCVDGCLVEEMMAGSGEGGMWG